ncbi:MAG: GNAT family N-acetyltransferase [Gemmatimonadota bacterium]|nr:GNAT family N-acetyltransferase [Gemmatimonadota bacterium]
MRLHIRRGNPGDAATLAAFAAQTFFDTYAAQNTPEDMAAHLASAYGVGQQGGELADPEVVTLLAEDGEVLAGFAQLRRGRAPECVTHARAHEVHRFYVAREYHGRGVSRLLMRAVMAAARVRGATHLWLSVWERNPRAIAFYGKMGFVPEGTTYFVVGQDRQDDLVLVAPIGVGDAPGTPNQED